MGWPVAWKCRVACLFFEESQQPTCPQIRHSRRCTQVSPIFRQSSQPFALGVTSRIWSRCVQVCINVPLSLSIVRWRAQSEFRTVFERRQVDTFDYYLFGQRGWPEDRFEHWLAD